MHYFPFHINDFRAGTRGLNLLERGVYVELLQCYYDTEKPLPKCVEAIYFMLGAHSDQEKEIVQKILTLKFKKSRSGYVNARTTRELSKFKELKSSSKAGGIKSGIVRRAKADMALALEKKLKGTSSTDQDPLNQSVTKNQEPLTNKKTSAKPKCDECPMFNELWDTFSDKRGKMDAMKAWAKLKPDRLLADRIIEGARHYVKTRSLETQYWKQLSGWLNGQRWLDSHADTVATRSTDRFAGAI
jgi:uncharacterized protein YdaU (DUF1376 family)